MRLQLQLLGLLLAAAGTGVLGVGAAAAAPVWSTASTWRSGGFVNPAYQGEPNSTYQLWDNFTGQTPSAGINAHEQTNANGVGALTSNGFVTSTGGIYHFAQQVNPIVVAPEQGLGADYTTVVSLQVAVAYGGVWLDLNNITVTPDGGDAVGLASGIEYYHYPASASVPLLATTTSNGAGQFVDLGDSDGEVPGGMGGSSAVRNFQFLWELPGNASDYTFNILAEGTSMSLLAVQVDTWTYLNESVNGVPEPSTWALTGCGALGVGLLLARRRRSAENDVASLAL